MGLTIVQKSDLRKKKHGAKTALVLAGGAVSGGAFKAGGLKAFNDFLINRTISDFDIYVGISAGALLATPIAGGLTPEEIIKSLDGTSDLFSQLSPMDMFYPNFKEFVERPVEYFYERATFFPSLALNFVKSIPKLKSHLQEGFVNFLKEPNYSNYEKMLKPLVRSMYSKKRMKTIFSALPSGLFSNEPIEKYLRQNMKKNKLSNNFRVLKRMRGKDLYISAMELDSAENVVFGWDEKNDVTISEAVMASTALPGFYKPARIKGADYIDGGVRKTANIDLAIEKGAELVICYNPFRPIKNEVDIEYLSDEKRYVSHNDRIQDNGVMGVFNQVFRCLYHSRLQYAIERYRSDPNFQGDIILIEPEEDDSYFFEMNPFAFWQRAKAAKRGFDSVSESIKSHYDEIQAIVEPYGFDLSQSIINSDEAKMKKHDNDDNAIMDVLEHQSHSGAKKNKKRSKKLRVIAGGSK